MSKRQERVRIGTDQRTVKITLITIKSPVYLVSINLWPFDYEHQDTCYLRFFDVKPTARQLRVFKKTSAQHFRHTRI